MTPSDWLLAEYEHTAPGDHNDTTLELIELRDDRTAVAYTWTPPEENL